MKKYFLLSLLICSDIFSMNLNFRDIIRADRKQEERRKQDLEKIENRLSNLKESGDDVGDDLEDIQRRTKSIRKKVLTNLELLLAMKQTLDDVKSTLAEREKDDDSDLQEMRRTINTVSTGVQTLLASLRVEQDLRNRPDPSVAHLLEIKQALGAINDRQIQATRNSYLGTFLAVGAIAARFGINFLPDWVWVYIPGAS